MMYRVLKLAGAVVLLSHASLTLASDKSVTIFPAEGNKQCSDYSANSVIVQMGATSVLPNGTLSGADNPKDADTNPESATYTVTGLGTVFSFSGATTPIDYAVLKGGGGKSPIAVLIYPSGGVTSDANLTVMVANVPQLITGISLCYGLGNTTPPPPPPEVIPNCTDLTASLGGLDTVGITCPANGKKSVVFNLELGQPFYNTNGSPIACMCNSAAVQCDPSVPAGQPNACPNVLSPSKMPAEVTTHIELNNDPYYCTTVAGIRKCYSY